MTVDELFKQVASVTANKRSWDTVEHRIQYYKTCIDFYSEENSHLKNSKNGFTQQYYPIARDVADYLNGSEHVNGNCLLFYYCGHDGYGFIRNFECIVELEKAVFKYGEPDSRYFYTEILSILINEMGECEIKVYVNG